jgi:D-serine deaminase-like pyridoxal phosphate-dependent protein
MTLLNEFRCDGCEKVVPFEDAHGWLSVATMQAPAVSTPVELLHAHVCSLDCLVEWADRKAFEEEEPVPFVRILPVNPPGPTPYL